MADIKQAIQDFAQLPPEAQKKVAESPAPVGAEDVHSALVDFHQQPAEVQKSILLTMTPEGPATDRPGDVLQVKTIDPVGTAGGELMRPPTMPSGDVGKQYAERAKEFGRKALLGTGAGLGGLAGFASPVPGGLAAGAMLGGGAGKILGDMVLGPEAPPVERQRTTTGLLPGLAEMAGNIPASMGDLSTGILGSMGGLSQATFTPGGGQQVLQGTKQMVTDLAEPDKWVTNPATNFATLGMFVDPAMRGIKSVGLKGNPELIAAAAQHDVPLGLGEATGIPALSRASVALERVPLVGTSSAMKVGSSKAGAAADRLLGRFTPSDTADVPDQIQASMLKTLAGRKEQINRTQNVINAVIKRDNVGPLPTTEVMPAAQELVAKHFDMFSEYRLPDANLKKAVEKLAKGRSNGLLGNNATRTPVDLQFQEALRLRKMLNSYIQRAYKSSGAVGSEETNALVRFKSALDNDINTFGANSSNAKVVELFRKRDRQYIEKIVPFKDAIVKKSTGLDFDTDLLMQNFVRPDRPQLARKLMDNMTPEGRQLVRYHVLKKAVDAGNDTAPGVPFSPAKFAAELERLGPTLDVVFDSDTKMVRGFTKLMRATYRYGQFAENQSNGSRLIDFGVGGAFVTGMMNAPYTTMSAAATIKLMSSMLTQPWGRSLLLRASSLPPGSPMFSTIVNSAMYQSFMDTMRSERGSIELPDIEGKYLRGSSKSAPQDIYAYALESNAKNPIEIFPKDGVKSFEEAVDYAQGMGYIRPDVQNARQEMRYSVRATTDNSGEAGMIGNDKMAYPNAQYPQGRNTYDMFGCGRGEYCRFNRLELEPCYGGDCYASRQGATKGRSVVEGTSNVGLKKNSAMYASVKDFWESHNNDIEATRVMFPEFRINFHKATTGKNPKPENFSVAIPKPPKGAQVFTKLQNAKGQDIRLGVDTDGSAWISDPKVLDALDKADTGNITVYSAGYYEPPPPHPLVKKAVINVTVSGWHPLPETLKRIEWAEKARANGWNVVLREVVADAKTFPDDAPIYNRIHDLVDQSNFYSMAQPLHKGPVHGTTIGKDAAIMPRCCVGTSTNPHTCKSCQVSEGLGQVFKQYWENRGKQPFDDAQILPAFPEFRTRQAEWAQRNGQ